jgi:hypothetical protein
MKKFKFGVRQDAKRSEREKMMDRLRKLEREQKDAVTGRCDANKRG